MKFKEFMNEADDFSALLQYIAAWQKKEGEGAQYLALCKKFTKDKVQKALTAGLIMRDPDSMYRNFISVTPKGHKEMNESVSQGKEKGAKYFYVYIADLPAFQDDPDASFYDVFQANTGKEAIAKAKKKYNKNDYEVEGFSEPTKLSPEDMKKAKENRKY